MGDTTQSNADNSQGDNERTGEAGNKVASAGSDTVAQRKELARGESTMGIFSEIKSAVGVKRKPTKMIVARRVAALIYGLKREFSTEQIAAGTIVLNKDFTVAFRGRESVVDYMNILAQVSPKDHLKKILPIRDELSLRQFARYFQGQFVDRLTWAVIEEFEDQSGVFNSLQSIFDPIGPYVFLGQSAQFLDACNKEDDEELARLLGQVGKNHVVMETYESIGEAQQRRDQMEGAFSGAVAAFESHLIRSACDDR